MLPTKSLSLPGMSKYFVNSTDVSLKINVGLILPSVLFLRFVQIIFLALIIIITATASTIFAVRFWVLSLPRLIIARTLAVVMIVVIPIGLVELLGHITVLLAVADRSWRQRYCPQGRSVNQSPTSKFVAPCSGFPYVLNIPEGASWTQMGYHGLANLGGKQFATQQVSAFGVPTCLWEKTEIKSMWVKRNYSVEIEYIRY